MPLIPGTRLGAYEIISPLGAGGMGEVYRARDVRLGREVAIKGLPDAFARHPARLARIEREARLLASLNHPNIAGIYGLEEAGGTPYLVLELVLGETLSKRLGRGALPVREALDVAGQVAAAIEAAHERGIVHRDLKPDNVMLTASRAVKVLDFGIAKEKATQEEQPSDGPEALTLSASATAAGAILGTVAYMSPEQARGRSVDRRADVWAFGCVLYECLTARQTFTGDTALDVIAHILEHEPDWSLIPASVPARLRDMTRRCLTKDVQERPRDIGDLRRELTDIALELTGSSGGRLPSTAALPSLAVLYFENLAKDPESDYFCAGITEDILTDLSKIKGLRVASRNAVARYRGEAVDLPKAAAELGVGAVLEGSVRRAGDRLRITAQLINASDGFHLWAERYDRTMEDVFAVQEEIASSIAEALRVALTPTESATLVKDRPKDVRAYDLYLRGRELYGRYTDAALREAMGLFQQAIEIDPKYALAWAGIADSYGQLCQWGKSVNIPETTRLGLEAARRAIALNPRLPEAYKAEALNLVIAGDEEAARSALRRALEVNPRFMPALANLTVLSFNRADLAAAERYCRRAVEADPQDPFPYHWLAQLTYMTRRLDETIATAHRIRQLSKDPFPTTVLYAALGYVHLARGDRAAAVEAMREGLSHGAEPNDMRAIEAMVAAVDGRTDEARAMVRELCDATGHSFTAQLLIAGASVRLGDVAMAPKVFNPVMIREVDTAARLDPNLHPILDLPQFGPRRRDAALIWPLEAPMMDPSVHRLFREVRIESGLPPASDLS
ncbi:MAG TPA: protein kinase [Candidatus Omnitrophota bacterium]|nr:protein kinase [Candidatus Omnitrophota bacterium]